MNESLNQYSHHAPKIEWFEQFFRYKEDFHSEHTLGTQMYAFFRRFLKQAQLIDREGHLTPFAYTLDDLGLKKDVTWALMLCHLVINSRQIRWATNNIETNIDIPRDILVDKLTQYCKNQRAVHDIIYSLGRFMSLPFCDVGLGNAKYTNKHLVSVYRTGWLNPDLRVLLYSLYLLGSQLKSDSFTVSKLTDEEISPVYTFGIDLQTMIKYLYDLNSTYNEYISYKEGVIYLNNNKNKIIQLF